MSEICSFLESIETANKNETFCNSPLIKRTDLEKVAPMVARNCIASGLAMVEEGIHYADCLLNNSENSLSDTEKVFRNY